MFFLIRYTTIKNLQAAAVILSNTVLLPQKSIKDSEFGKIYKKYVHIADFYKNKLKKSIDFAQNPV